MSFPTKEFQDVGKPWFQRKSSWIAAAVFVCLLVAGVGIMTYWGSSENSEDRYRLTIEADPNTRIYIGDKLAGTTVATLSWEELIGDEHHHPLAIAMPDLARIPDFASGAGAKVLDHHSFEGLMSLKWSVNGDRYMMPKAIDRKDTAGMFKGKTALGIYKLEKGEFTICFAAPGKERPTEFTTKSGTGVFLYVWKQQEGWVYHSKEHGFSMKLPSSYWREAKSKSLVAFTHVSLPMKAFVTSVKQGPKETFEASVQRLKDFLDKNGDQLLQKPEVVEQEDKAGNKRWCVVLKEKGRDGAEYMLVGISYTWIKEKGITIETEFEGSMTAKSNYFKALEKESFEKSVKEICLSVE